MRGGKFNTSKDQEKILLAKRSEGGIDGRKKQRNYPA